jgi:hypothetical protein
MCNHAAGNVRRTPCSELSLTKVNVAVLKSRRHRGAIEATGSRSLSRLLDELHVVGPMSRGSAARFVLGCESEWQFKYSVKRSAQLMNSAKAKFATIET